MCSMAKLLGILPAYLAVWVRCPVCPEGWACPRGAHRRPAEACCPWTFSDWLGLSLSSDSPSLVCRLWEKASDHPGWNLWMTLDLA